MNSYTKGRTHLVIPDCQVRPDVPLDHLEWIGNLIVEIKPDVVVCLGDFADMESLCSYDKGKKCFEGRRYRKDIECSKRGMRRLLTPVTRYNNGLRRNKKRLYQPEYVLTLGNHEDRIDRAIQGQPELEGVISVDDLSYESFGWNVYPYLAPVQIDGVTYSHYFYNKLSGRPHPNSRLMLHREHMSCTQGHVQILDYDVQYTGDGRALHGLRVGACYLHDEAYKGPQGNAHWRGVVLKTNVRDGMYDPQFISIESLGEEYGRRNRRKAQVQAA